VLQGWVEKENQALKRGYDGLRLSGNTFWLAKRDWRNFTNYEEEVNNVIRKYRMIAICTYSLGQCRASEVIDVVSNHQFALIRREGKWVIIESSEHKQAEEMLRESEERYRALFESINDAVLVSYIDDEGSAGYFVQVNDVACQRLGYTREELLGLTPQDITTPKNYKRLLAKREKLMSKGNTVVETVHMTRDGRQIPVESSVRLFNYLGKRAAISISRDITERKQVEKEAGKVREQLEQLNKHLIKVREDERGLISRDIHDELGQSLTAIKIDLHWVLENVGDKPAVKQKLNNMLKMVSGTIATVQRITSDLRPGILDDLGLASAIEWYCEEFEKRTGIQCRMDLEDIQPQDPQKIITLFRILQEALTNVIRHAHAKNVTIKLSRLHDAVNLEIQDDGIGISQEKIDFKSSLGLIGIRERVRQFGGEFEIFSPNNNGTGLRISIPLNE
jgi:PAS domain S-box-containing protein